MIAAPHQGFPSSIRAAIAATAAPYLGWVDSDDLLAPTALEETIAILNAHPNIGLVYTNHLLIDEQGTDLGLGRQCRIPYDKDRLLVDFMVMHFRLMRRTVYEQVGGIDPSIAYAEDYDLCLKLSEVTDLYHLPRPLYSYRRHSGNVTNQQVKVIESAAEAITNALKRRKLDAHYHLHISPTFSLRPKPPIPDQPPPPIQHFAAARLTPLVTIIIPAYNAAPRLRSCLQSCLQQTYPHLEILLVDNGSTDNTVQIAQTIAHSTPRPIQILHCSQRGANAARNFGFTHAQGDYIQWLDADDDLAPDKIECQLLALAHQPEADIAYGDWDWCFWSETQPLAQLRFGERDYDDFLLQTLIDNWRPPHAYLLRRRTAVQLHALQAWHPDTSVYMDREYFTIAALLGFRFLYVPNSYVRYYRWSPTQISRRATHWERVEQRRRIYRRLQDIAYFKGQITPAHRFLLYQDWSLWHPTFTLHYTEHGAILQHPHHPDPLPLSPSEATIARALLNDPHPRPLEDHARRVIQQLWLEILLELQQTNAPELDYTLIADKLSWHLGCSSTLPAGMVEQSLPPENLQSLPPLLQEVPLFTPLLGKERLVVQQFLDRLRQKNWLQKVALNE